MLELLVWAIIATCGVGWLYAYVTYHDVFHPLIYMAPMFAFVYGYMPLKLINSQTLFAYVTEQQATFATGIIFCTTLAFVIGCIRGSQHQSTPKAWTKNPSPGPVRWGAYALGMVGLIGWGVTVANQGGLSGAYGESYGGGWSDYGYVRDLNQLLIPALLLLLSPVGFHPRSWLWRIAVIAFSIPWFMQGLLGARRGPTFIIVITLVMSWFLTRRRRPSLLPTVAAGAGLGLLMLILVSNRGKIYLGSDFNIDVSAVQDVTSATEANEYVFGSGCIVTTHQTGSYYWGRRWLAYLVVRPIPRQLWPNKYEDLGVGAIENNAGVAGAGLESVMGWRQIPGAAATLAPDLWVEVSWLCIPVAGLIGWLFGYSWRRAIAQDHFWPIFYMILATASLHLVTQGTADVFYRILVGSIPSALVWRYACARGEGAASPGTVPYWQRMPSSLPRG